MLLKNVMQLLSISFTILICPKLLFERREGNVKIGFWEAIVKKENEEISDECFDKIDVV